MCGRGRRPVVRKIHLRSVFLFALCCVLCNDGVVVVSGSGNEPEGDYLYKNDLPPIIEYMRKEFDGEVEDNVDKAVREYLAGADREGYARRRAKFEMEMTHPDFLFSEHSGPRVVEYYAPWCPHCQDYKWNYVYLAQQVRSQPGGKNVQFYAVSCTAHRPICQEFGIRSYPRMQIYKAGSTESQIFKKNDVTVKSIFMNLGIDPDEGTSGSQGGAVDDTSRSREGGVVDKPFRSKDGEPSVRELERITEAEGEAVADTKEEIRRTREDIYRDASLSFDFALRNAVYMDKGPLSKDIQRYLEQWLDLMRKTMPLEMTLLHKQIDAIQFDFPQVVTKEAHLVEAIKELEPDTKTWSKSCTHGKKIGGYTCGLWEMFHIMTVGVAEWNIRAPRSLRVSTNRAAETLRNYIEHFFGCGVCQANFVRAYDSCARDRCNRLNERTETATLTDWKELPLWLWETHNDVNVRLLKEKAVRENKQMPTEDDQQAARWPAKADCPRCWNDDWSWNVDVVYSFLRLEYWPEDDITEHHRNLKHFDPVPVEEPFKWEDHLEEPADHSSMIFYGAAFFPVGAMSIFSVWWLYQKKEKDRTGLHKKFDASHHGWSRNGTTPGNPETCFSDRV